MRAPGARL